MGMGVVMVMWAYFNFRRLEPGMVDRGLFAAEMLTGAGAIIGAWMWRKSE